MSLYQLRDAFNQLSATAIDAFKLKGGRIAESLAGEMNTPYEAGVLADATQRIADVHADVANNKGLADLLDNTLGKLPIHEKRAFMQGISKHDFKSETQYPEMFDNFNSLANQFDDSKVLANSGYSHIMDAYKDMVHTTPERYMRHQFDKSTRVDEFGNQFNPEGDMDLPNHLSNGFYVPGMKKLINKTPGALKENFLDANKWELGRDISHLSDYNWDKVDYDAIAHFKLGEQAISNMESKGMRHYVSGLVPKEITDDNIVFDAANGSILDVLRKKYMKSGGDPVRMETFKTAADIFQDGHVRRNIEDKAIAMYNASILTNNFHTILKTLPDILRIDAPLEMIGKQVFNTFMPTGGGHYSDKLFEAMLPHTSKSFYDGTTFKGMPDATKWMEAKLRAANFATTFEKEIMSTAQNEPYLKTLIDQNGGIDGFMQKFIMDKKFQTHVDATFGRRKSGLTFKKLWNKGMESVRYTQGAISPLDHRPIAHSGAWQTLFPYRDAAFASAGRTFSLAKQAAAGDKQATQALGAYLRPYVLTMAAGTSLSATLGDKAYELIVNGLSAAGLTEQAMAIQNMEEQTKNSTGLASFVNSNLKSTLPTLSDISVGLAPDSTGPAGALIEALTSMATDGVTDPTLRAVSSGAASIASIAANHNPTLAPIAHLISPSIFSRAVSEGSKMLGINPQSLSPGVYRDNTGVRSTLDPTAQAMKVLLNSDPVKQAHMDGMLSEGLAKNHIESLVDQGATPEQVILNNPDMDEYLTEAAIKKGMTDPEKIEKYKLRFIRQATSGKELRSLSEMASTAFNEDTPEDERELLVEALQSLGSEVNWEETNYDSFEEFLTDKLDEAEKD